MEVPFVIGDIVCLTGRSRHGKNRVQEQGDAWEVIEPMNNGKAGMLLQCCMLPREKRWVHPTFDNDFRVQLWEDTLPNG